MLTAHKIVSPSNRRVKALMSSAASTNSIVARAILQQALF
jgi:hypothetical protein